LLQLTPMDSSIAPTGSIAAARDVRVLAPLQRAAASRSERPPSAMFGYCVFKVGGSGSFFHAAQPDAGRAHANLFLYAVHHRADAPQVRVPPPPPRVVRVADYVAVVRRFAAQFTLRCHGFSYFSKCRRLSVLFYQTPSPATKYAFYIPVVFRDLLCYSVPKRRVAFLPVRFLTRRRLAAAP